MASVWGELRRRNVVKVAVAYAIVGWLLVEVTSVVLPTFKAPEWIMQVFTFLVIVGFPLALIFAWAYELTPEGIKKEKEVDRSRSITRQTGRKLDFIIIGVLIVAVGVLWYKLGQDRSDTPAVGEQTLLHESVDDSTAKIRANSIAVLPFVNMSADAENEYFSDGMTEEIISKLARIQNLSVASRTSVVRFKNSDSDVKNIAASLGVRYVLEGSVRKAGNEVRITAQLIDSDTGFHLWAEDFDGELDDIFDVQERTALKIAEALDLKLTPQEQQAVQRRYTDNSAAYDAYLRGQALVQFFDDIDKLAAARAHFEKALKLEPNFPPALSGLASVEAHTYRNIDADEERLQRGMALASRALELDPELVRGHIAIGELAAMQYDYRRAIRNFREAIAMEPENPWAWDMLSWTLAYQQPPDPIEAEAAAREAIRLQPQFAYAYYHLGRALILQDRLEEAVTAFEYILEFNPKADIAYLGLLQAYLALGEYEKAQQEAERILVAEETPIVLVYVSYIMAAQGDRDGALNHLERALELHYRDFAALESAPYLDKLRSDPRYEELIERYRTSEKR